MSGTFLIDLNVSVSVSELPGLVPMASGDSSNACKRLQKELMTLMMSQDEGISAFPDVDNILNWKATIQGTDGTPYEGPIPSSPPPLPPPDTHSHPLLNLPSPLNPAPNPASASHFSLLLLFLHLPSPFLTPPSLSSHCLTHCPSLTAASYLFDFSKLVLLVSFLFVWAAPHLTRSGRAGVRALTRVPLKLPLRSSHNQVHHAMLPPQCRCLRQHLPRHPPG
eukprot:768225-Hanusia_phi.AAC.4